MFLRRVIARVLDDAFAGTERKVQAAVASVALLKALDDAKRVQVVIEAQAVMAQALVQRAFSGMSEGRVADVVDQGKGLSEVYVEIEGRGDVSRHLRDLHGMRETATEVVGGTTREDLRLARETTECARLHDTVTVALERHAIIAGGRREGTARKSALVLAEDTECMQVVNHRLSVA